MGKKDSSLKEYNSRATRSALITIGVCTLIGAILGFHNAHPIIGAFVGLIAGIAIVSYFI